MPIVIGIALAAVVSAFAAVAGFDRDRAFYPTVVLVVASYYVLFAVVGGSTHAILVESMVMTAFLAAAVAGFRLNLWVVAAALAAHGAFDAVHAHLVTNPGVPAWWPAFCGAYDLMAAGVLAWLLRHRTTLAKEP
jgi:hypothetical protein